MHRPRFTFANGAPGATQPADTFSEKPKTSTNPSLNAAAADFRPNEPQESPGMVAKNSSVVLARQNGNPSSMTDVQILEEKITMMRNAFAEEMYRLRSEVDTLMTGGWTVTLGPIRSAGRAETGGVTAMHERLALAMSLGPQPKHIAVEKLRQESQEGFRALTISDEYDSDASTINKPTGGPAQESEKNIKNSEPIVDDGIVEVEYGKLFPKGPSSPQQLTTKTEPTTKAEPDPKTESTKKVQPTKEVEATKEAELTTKALTEHDKADGTLPFHTPKAPAPQTASIPPHLRKAGVATAAPSVVTAAATNGTKTVTGPASNGTTVADPDKPLPSVEDPAHLVATGKSTWLPLAVDRMKPLAPDIAKKIPANMVTFSWSLLEQTFGGLQWSPGLYFKPKSHGSSVLAGRTFYAFDATHEPYLPLQPGMHGAKLTAFFRENCEDTEDDPGESGCMNVPLFISCTGGSADKSQYKYFGQYSQTRWSDKLDFDRMVQQVPHEVKTYWAERLTDMGRPEWVTQALMKHFWPKPEYEGVIPDTKPATGSVANEESVDGEKALHDAQMFVEDLQDWKADAGVQVRLLKKGNILEAFGSEDAGDPPGLRLWWEYLECVEWDQKFYETLVKRQTEIRARNRR